VTSGLRLKKPLLAGGGIEMSLILYFTRMPLSLEGRERYKSSPSKNRKRKQHVVVESIAPSMQR
jgi:hypothetical protein